MQFQIKNRFSGAVQFECELSAEMAGKSYSLQLGFAVKKAVEQKQNLTRANLIRANLIRANLIGADLTEADLTEADLTRANLTRANLIGANLTRANLTWADLTGANLIGADLTEADLTEADLTRANLTGANLIGADLTWADLTGANLIGADLIRANLIGADLTVARNDLWDVLLRAHAEVPGLLCALRAGKVDGSSYDGECACLVGTIANTRHVDYQSLGNGLRPDSSRPAERWFLAILEGDTPETSPIAKITEGWIVEFLGFIGDGAAVASKEG